MIGPRHPPYRAGIRGQRRALPGTAGPFVIRVRRRQGRQDPERDCAAAPRGVCRAGRVRAPHMSEGPVGSPAGPSVLSVAIEWMSPPDHWLLTSPPFVMVSTDVSWQ